MTVFWMDKPLTVPDGATLASLIAAHSPFGSDPVIALVNGERRDPDAPTPLSAGDRIYLYPLLIGG